MPIVVLVFLAFVTAPPVGAAEDFKFEFPVAKPAEVRDDDRRKPLDELETDRARVQIIEMVRDSENIREIKAILHDLREGMGPHGYEDYCADAAEFLEIAGRITRTVKEKSGRFRPSLTNEQLITLGQEIERQKTLTRKMRERIWDGLKGASLTLLDENIEQVDPTGDLGANNHSDWVTDRTNMIVQKGPRKYAFAYGPANMSITEVERRVPAQNIEVKMDGWSTKVAARVEVDPEGTTLRFAPRWAPDSPDLQIDPWEAAGKMLALFLGEKNVELRSSYPEEMQRSFNVLR